MDGIGGTDGKIKQREACLWVAFRAMANNGMVISSEGFFDGRLPLTATMLKNMRAQMMNMAQENFDKVKPVDQQGKLIMGAPKVRAQMVEIVCIQPAEHDVEVTVN